MDKLWTICEREGIHGAYRPLYPGLLGMYWRGPDGKPYIVLDASLPARPRLERSVLAEEVGHHMVGTLATVCLHEARYAAGVAIGRDEHRAIRWALDFLIPTWRLLQALRRGVIGVVDLADLFDVVPWAVERKLKLLEATVEQSAA